MPLDAISGATVAGFLGLPLKGEDLAIRKPADLSDCGPGDMVWVRECTPERLAILASRRPALAICDALTSEAAEVPTLSTPNPRLAFVRALNRFFAAPLRHGIDPTAVVAPEAVIGRGVWIGPYCRIGAEVTIGNECQIASGVVLDGPVELGARCRIKSNSVVGEPGFGFEYDEQGVPLHFPHLGKVVLEDDVWLGACSTIERATLGETRVCQGCKIDDLVQIGHNTRVGRNTLIMANSILCGGAIVGEKCWIAPNSVLKQKVRLGDRVVVGLGAVVLKDVADGTVVAGVPAKPLRSS